jgi:hypothetical protein
MKSKTRVLLETMTDAIVIDVDLSEWDRRLRFVCAHEGDDLSAASDVNQIDFIRATSMSWNASKPMRVRQGDDRHIRWTIWAIDVVEVDRGYKVQLRGSGPEVEIECEDIDVTVLDARLVAVLNRSWFEPGQPLARPGIEALTAKILGPHVAGRGSDSR